MFIVVAKTRLSSVLIVLLIYYNIDLRAQIPHNDIQRILASWGKAGTPTSDQAHYPTDFSRGIIPIPCHSHNDYLRSVPLYDALQAGCMSIEVDIWLRDGDLLVGHTSDSLTPARTLRTLYLDPLASILKRQGKHSSDAARPPFASTNTRGIYESNTSTSLTLLLDLKTDGHATLPLVQQQLEPFRSAGWLTHSSNTSLVPGPLTIVGSGTTPFSFVSPPAPNDNKNNTTTTNDTRTIFYDAPLSSLWSGDNTDLPSNHTVYNPLNSHYASAKFSTVVGAPWHGVLRPAQVEIIRAQVRAASARGLGVRYWDTPAWPIRTRNHVWDVLVKEGVGVLNVDDLEGVSRRSW